jgi:putative spermidine/putrescine transport system permease protein
MAMSISTREIDAARIRRRQQTRLPGDPGRPLTQSTGAGRFVRVSGSITLAALFLLPLVPVALWSIADHWEFPSALPTTVGLRGLRTAIDQGAPAAFMTSLGLALSVAAIATPLGAIAARSLVGGWAPAPRLLTALLFAPIALPPLAAVFGVNVLLLRADVPPMVGVVVVLVVVAIPYTTFSMRVAYSAHDMRFEEEARTLGASRKYVFWHVQLPLLSAALARSAFLAFLVGWSDYIVTLIVGGGQLVTLPLITASMASGIGNNSTVGVLSLSAFIPPIALLGLLTCRVRRRSGAVL